VLHTAEGARTIEDLGHFFQNTANQVSSHTGADDKRGVIGEYVTRGNKAWTAANYNPVAVQLELCGFASWSRDTWLNSHSNMLHNAAEWIAEESKKFGLPITGLSDYQAQGSGRGVCQHINLGAGGGGHVNCGPGFPMDKVLEWARGGGQPEPEPPKFGPQSEDAMESLDARIPNHGLLIPYGTKTMNLLAPVPDGSPCKVRVTFQGMGSQAQERSCSFGEGAREITVPQGNKQGKLEILEGGGEFTLAVRWNE
jgi:hypothetical protein